MFASSKDFISFRITFFWCT